jgi:hypothetical protein
MNPFDLEWGEVTPEGYDKDQNQAFHVINCSMIGLENRRRCLVYLVGRVAWFSKHLPKGCSHRIRIDTSGQIISVKVLNAWRDSVIAKIGARMPTAKVEIEFLV